MFISWIFGVLFLFIFGGYWCYEVIARLQDDIAEFRQADEPGTKISIIIIWLITVLIATALLGVGFMLAVVLISELRSWFSFAL